MEALPDNMAFALSYTTDGFPVDLNGDKDIKHYEPFLSSPPGLTVSNGTVLRHVDFPPTNTPIMHRTVSLDYGVVLEGEIYCVLDSGEERLMKRGGEFDFLLCYDNFFRPHRPIAFLLLYMRSRIEISGLTSRTDVCIQRGTMHAWRNASDKEWCRMMFVLQPCKHLEVGDKKLGENLGNAVGMPDSK